MLQRNFGISYLFSLSPPAKNLHQKKEKKNPCVYMAGVYLEKPVNPFLSLKTSFSCRKESLFVLQTLAKNYLWGMFTKVSSGLIFSPSFGWKCSHQCSYLPVLEPAVLHWGTAEQLEAGVTMAVSVRQFHRCHLQLLKQKFCSEEVSTIPSYHTCICQKAVTCPCTPAVGHIYGFNGAACADVWHSDMPRVPGTAFTRTAAPALGSLCPFFPGWQGAMPYHKASIVGT